MDILRSSTLAVLALALFLLIPETGTGSTAKPILIGATVSLEGKYREPSEMVQSGYGLWVKEVNARGGLLGRPVKLILYDDRSRAARVKRLYERLIYQDRVDLVFSPYGTPLTLAASEVSEQNRRVMLACAASGEKIWDRGFRYVFGVYALANRYFIGMLDLMAREGIETVTILHEDSPFNIDVAEGAADWAKRFGLAVALRKSFVHGAIELPSLMGSVVDTDSPGLIVAAYPQDCHLILDLMKAVRFKPRAMGMTIAPIHPDFYKQVGPFAEGIMGPSQWEPDERIPFPGTRKFIDDFQSFARKQPSYHAGSAYAACQIMEKAVTTLGGLDQAKVRDFILALDTVTVIGRFKVDHQGKQIGHNPILVQWQNERKEIVYPTKMQTAPVKF